MHRMNNVSFLHPRRKNRHEGEVPFSRWIPLCNKASPISVHLPFSVFFPFVLLAWDQPMFLFVQARIARATTKGTLPFSRDLHKISILSAFGKNIDESRTSMHESLPLPPSSWSSFCSYRETGSSRFNERHHKGEIVIFTGLPDFAVASLAFCMFRSPLLRPRIGPLSIAVLLLLNLLQTHLSTLPCFFCFCVLCPFCDRSTFKICNGLLRIRVN